MSAGRAGDGAPERGAGLVDLTHPLLDGMPVYPGDPRVDIVSRGSVTADGYAVRGLHLGSHTGTHVDAPAHVLDGAATLDDLPLERFVGSAVLIDARGLPPRTPITPDRLDSVRDRLQPGVVVLLVTGWSRWWGEPAYADHPWLTPAFAQALLDGGVRTIGVDTLSVDPTPVVGPLHTHLALARAGAVIAENLTGLEPLLQAQARGLAVEVSLLPLRIGDGDGAPVRAVARVHPARSA